MQNKTTQWRRATQFLEKYTFHFIERLGVRGSWRQNRTATYWPPLYWPKPRFFPVLLGCSTGDLGAQPLWDMFSFPHLVCNWNGLQTAQSGVWWLPLLGAGFLYRILSPTGLVSKTDGISCVLSYIIVQRPPSSCGRHKLHSFNPSTVKATFYYSSTGCTCYLHRCISYFDCLAGS